MAEHLSSVWGVDPRNVFRFKTLTMDDARSVSFLGSMPGNRLFIVQADATSPAVLEVLLKALEESSTARFILVSTKEPPKPVTSRCSVFRFALLSTGEVEQVLLGMRFSKVNAATLAESSGGQVSTALALSKSSGAKIVVLAASRAIRERDESALEVLAPQWTDEHTRLMVTLATETITGRLRVFEESDVEGADRKTALSVLRALYPQIRPRLVVRSSLMSVLRGAA